MLIYIFMAVGLLILIPLLFIAPIGLHRTGKIVIGLIAFFCAVLYSFSTHLLPIWQSALAVLALLLAAALLLNKRDFMLVQHDEDIDDAGPKQTEEISLPIVVNEASEPFSSEVIEDVGPTSADSNQTEQLAIDENIEMVTEVLNNITEPTEPDHEESRSVTSQEEESEKDEHAFLEEFFNQLDSTDYNHPDQQVYQAEIAVSEETYEDTDKEIEVVELEDQAVSEILDLDQEQIDSISNDEAEPLTDSPSIEDDINLFEEMLDNHTPNSEESQVLPEKKTNNDIEDELLELFGEKTESQPDSTTVAEADNEAEKPLALLEDEIDSVEETVPNREENTMYEELFLNDENLNKDLVSDKSGDKSTETDIFEDDMQYTIDETTDVQQELDNSKVNDKDQVTKLELSNEALDMLLQHVQMYKQIIPEKYEDLLLVAVNEARSEKDQFLFAKQLLIFYLESGKKTEFDLFFNKITEELKHYPLLVKQLEWINNTKQD